MIPFYKRKKPFVCPKYFIRNDYLKFIYCSLFSEFSLNELEEFWSPHRVTLEERKLSLRETIEHIWKVDNLSPFEYVFGVLNSLEPFFVSNGKDIKGFLVKNILKKQFGTTIIPRLAIWAMEPILKIFIQANDDSQTLFLKYVHVLNERIRPGTVQKLVKLEDCGDKFKGLVVFAPDLSFRKEFSWVDGELFFATTLQYPTRFGINPYDSYEMISESQSALQRMSRDLKVNVHEGQLFINGKIFGEEKQFSEFLKNRNIHLKNILSCPDGTIIEITRDYYCPQRKRIVLHKGCAYGAPVYIYAMIYSKKNKKKYSISQLFADVFKNGDAEREVVSKKHEEFIRLLDTVFIFRYDSESGYIFLNDKFVTRGVQAKILGRMVKIAFEQKRFEFEHKEFIGEQQFITDSLNTGFVTRLHRIETRLNKISPYIQLKKTSKGKVALKSSLPIQYIEK